MRGRLLQAQRTSTVQRPEGGMRSESARSKKQVVWLECREWVGCGGGAVLGGGSRA